MKNQTSSLLETGAGSRCAHRSVQGRFESEKPQTHRYERRKVRQFLRHAGTVGLAEVGLGLEP